MTVQHTGPENTRAPDPPPGAGAAYPAYPDAEEKSQRIAEETLLHLLYQERFREALMAVRNLERRSLAYLERITQILDGQEDARPVHERTLKHANRSMQFQDGMMLYSKRRSSLTVPGSRDREVLAEILSVLILCRHRNDLIRRLLMVSLGRGIRGGEASPAT